VSDATRSERKIDLNFELGSAPVTAGPTADHDPRTAGKDENVVAAKQSVNLKSSWARSQPSGDPRDMLSSARLFGLRRCRNEGTIRSPKSVPIEID
jgi:hypothetical protein